MFSPPYFNAIKKGGEGPHADNKRISYEERIKRFQGYSTNPSKASILHEESTKELQLKRSGPFAVKKNLPTPYSSKLENIGNLSEFGSIIFSPPYEGALNASKHVGGIALRDPQLASTGQYSRNMNNFGTL